MKKLILPLLLLVAFGMLAAVESAPSNVVGYVKYPCYTGTNIVAYPMGDDMSAEAALTPYLANMEAIGMWYGNYQSWLSITYDVEFGEWSGTLPLDNSGIMSLGTTGNFDFYSLGSPQDDITFTLYPGSNFVYVPLNRSDLNTAEELATEVGSTSSVSWYVNQYHSWGSLTYDVEFGEWSGTQPTSIGDPLVLYRDLGSPVAVWPVRGSASPSIQSNSKL